MLVQEAEPRVVRLLIRFVVLALIIGVVTAILPGLHVHPARMRRGGTLESRM